MCSEPSKEKPASFKNATAFGYGKILPWTDWLFFGIFLYLGSIGYEIMLLIILKSKSIVCFRSDFCSGPEGMSEE